MGGTGEASVVVAGEAQFWSRWYMVAGADVVRQRKGSVGGDKVGRKRRQWYVRITKSTGKKYYEDTHIRQRKPGD